MNALQILAAFLTTLGVISALSLIVAPGSTFGSAVTALFGGVSSDITAAKH